MMIFASTSEAKALKRKRENRPQVYIFSGPCGVGKSTITKALAEEMEKVVLIEGDTIHSMFIGKEQPAWDDQLSIVWKNIYAMTKNFIENDLNVIIDFVVESELEWFCEQLSEFDLNMYYVVLRADEDILQKRLIQRKDENLIKRSLFLLDKLENTSSNKPYLYDTTNKRPQEIINHLKDSFKQFRVNGK
ncbi:AAA family ATPase [Pseudalkalibacillus sp. R45]|uniref:AAA family ATPase n=1 Tax=Pseudalkalibacillus sp. R45 TaxID=3457433 RepID=UPI003FCD19DF